MDGFLRSFQEKKTSRKNKIGTFHRFTRKSVRIHLHSNRPADRGLTLIEIIASMVILLTVAVGSLTIVSYSKTMSIAAQEKMVAINLIEEKINYFRNRDLPTQVPAVCAGEAGAPGDYAGSVAAYLNAGSYEVCVRKPNPPNDEKCKEIKVEVKWTDRLGEQRKESAVVVLTQV